MCGIGGILRILKPGDADYPTGDESLRAPSGAWLWHGKDVRDLHYSPVAGATACPGGQAVSLQAPSPKPQAPGPPGGWLIPESWLDAIDENIKWRGPDGAGRFRDRVVKPDGTIVEVALIHRRLSIIDLEGGAQPMVVAKCPRCAEQALGTRHEARVPNVQCQVPSLSAVVFNGCIYNHRELRAELEAKGHVFESDHSDTEVILHGWSESRSESFLRLDGMFALGLWDRGSTKLVLTRDRVGEKPLYPVGTEGLYLFGSTSPSLLAGIAAISPDSDPPICPSSLSDWIAFGHAPEAMPIVNLSQSAAGTVMGTEPDCARDDDLPTSFVRRLFKRSSSSPNNSAESGISSPDHLENMLREAVRSRMEADVPLGCFLSGGIDSSLIALFARQLAGGLTTLTVRMPDAAYDESKSAQVVADLIGSNHVTLDCDPDSAANDLVHIIETLGLPFGDSSILPAYWLCRAAREHVKVALAGDGGDELFFGYDRYRVSPWFMPTMAWLAVMCISTGLFDRSDPRSRSERMARIIVAARHRGYTDLAAIFPSPDQRRLLGHQVGPEFKKWRHFTSSEARAFDLVHSLPGDLLRKVDTASMLCNIEVRCPFLAKAVVEAALATPARVHMKRGETKHLLKELARRHLPREIVDRPKQGFAVPISDWWRNDFGGLRTLLLDMLAGDKPFGRVHDVLEINMNFVRQMLDEHWAAGGLTPMHTTRHVRPRDHGQRLFALVSLAIWARSIHRGDAEDAEKTRQGMGSRE